MNSTTEETIDRSRAYHGAMPADDDEEKAARRFYGLPVTKQLVYYPYKADTKPINVDSYHEVQSYSGNYGPKGKLIYWYIFEVSLVNGNTIRINDSFLNEMQKPSFLADMQNEANGEEAAD